MDKGRIKHIKRNKKIEGDYILYWMQQSQRINYNHALNTAVILSNLHSIPLLVYFGLTENFPDGNLRHYTFMAEGLDYLKSEFNKMGVKFVIYNTSPEKGCIELMKNAAYLVMDKGYLRVQRDWRNKVIEESEIIGLENIMIVESDVIVPVEEVSNKEEYAARTIRPKIMKKLDDYAIEMEHIIPEINSFDLKLDYDLKEIVNPIEYVSNLDIDNSVKPSPIYKGGEKEARKKFKQFYSHSINHYLDKNHPEFIYNSFLSPYLHFGHISPVEIVVKLNNLLEKNPHIKEPMDDFIEELVVRRELAINFIYYNENYDEFNSMTYEWAYKTMEEHEADER
ncbi:MAG: deoxyribodipyrimidine photo-lyase, partial [Eubacteriales bacterium]